MNDHVQRRDAFFQETLTAIDDAVQRRCSQCHSPLPEDSASLWFCDPTEETDCQWSWHQAQAHRPREVYDGVDADYQIDMEQLSRPEPVVIASDGIRMPARVSFPDGSRHTAMATYRMVGNGVYEAEFVVAALEQHHHTHCQHEAACCRCAGHEHCRHIRIRPQRSYTELREVVRRLTNSGGT